MKPQKALKTCLLDLSAEKDIEPIDYILYDLIEGVTLMMMSLLRLTRNKRHITHMYPSVCVRRAIMEDE